MFGSLRDDLGQALLARHHAVEGDVLRALGIDAQLAGVAGGDEVLRRPRRTAAPVASRLSTKPAITRRGRAMHQRSERV